MAGVSLSTRSVAVAPGGVTTCTVTIKNTSAVVESYTIAVLGDAAGWATPLPATLSLFPGADGTVTIQFQPPRSATIRAGDLDFAVRVVATQDPDDSTVEEGSVAVQPFVDVSARITPRTSESKRAARHVVTVENRGNAPVTVDISAIDPDEALAFEPSPPALTIEPGDSEASSIKVVARKGFARGPAQHRPFQAFVTPPASSGHARVQLDATMVQKAGLPKFVPVLIGAAVIVALAAVLLPALNKEKGGGGLFSLTGANSGATTTVLAGDESGEEGAEAEADLEAAAASGGKDDDGGAGGTTSGAGAAAAASAGAAVSGSGSTATTTAGGVTSEDDGSTATTAAPKTATSTTAPASAGGSSSSSTTAAPTTTAPPATTAPPTTISYAGADRFVGSWSNGAGTCIAISRSSSSMSVTLSNSSGSSYGGGNAGDANDGDWSATFKATDTTQRYVLTTAGMNVTTSSTWSRGTTQSFTRVKYC